MSTSAFQSVILLLAIFQLVLAGVVFLMNPRRITNVVLSIYLLVFALYSAGVIGMLGAKTAEEAAPWTWLVALAGLQVSTGLMFLTLYVFRPAWLKRLYVSLPLVLLVIVPIVLVLIDGLFHTQLMYVGLDPRSYTGGYIELSAFLTTPIGVFFQLTNLFVLQFVQVIFLIYLLRQPDTRTQRAALVILLGIEVLGAVLQSVLRPIIGAIAVFTLIQSTTTAGVTLVVSQAGALSTKNLARLTRLINPGQRRFSVRARLLLLLIAIIAAIIGLQAGISIDTISQESQLNDQRRLTQLYNDYRSTVSEHEISAAALSTSFADRADVKALFKARDRAGLLQLLTPLFNTLKTQYNIVHLYLEDPDGQVFVRIHNPEQYGDDVTYRRTAAQTLATHQTVAGLEIGPSRLGVRSVSPLYDGSQFIGMLEVGLDYDQRFIDSLRNQNGADYRLWVSYVAAAPAGLKPAADAPAAPLDTLFFYASTTKDIPTVSAAVIQRVLSTGHTETQVVSDGQGQEWLVLVAPMQAYPDRTIGVIEIIGSRVAVLTNLRQNQITVLAIAAGLALLAITLMWVSTNVNVLNPLRHLTSVADRQLSGDLTARAQLETRDEFYQLGDTLNSLTAQLGDSIESLEHRVAARTEQLQASAEVGRAAASILDTERLLDEVVNLITNRFGFYYSAIFLSDAANKWAILHAATGEAGRILKERQHKLDIGGQSMVSGAITTRQPRIALDTGAESVRFANPLLPETRSEIALPLIVGDQVLGALDVQSTQAAAFDETYAAVLQSMADQIAIALSNTRQFEQTNLALRQANQLYEANREIASATDADGILQAVVKRVALDADRGTLILFGATNEHGEYAYLESVATYTKHKEHVSIQPGLRYELGQMPLAVMATPDKPIVIESLAQADASVKRTMRLLNTKATISLALAAGAKNLGSIVLGYRQPRHFTPDEIQTLQTLANQAAVTLRNQQLLAETQNALKQIDTINRRLTGQAWQVYTQNTGAMETVAAGPGVLAVSASGLQAVTLEPEQVKTLGPIGDVRSALIAPLALRGQVIGSLSLEEIDEKREWTDSEMTLLQTVANEVAVAIENARLIEQTERRADRERLITEINSRMLAANDLRDIVQIAGDELARVLNVARTKVEISAEYVQASAEQDTPLN
jgi:GAF domain-containing protein